MSSVKTNIKTGHFSSVPMALAVLIATVVGVVVPLTAEELPATIVDVRIEGNETIPTSSILQKIITQPNRAVSNRQVREDKRSLMMTRWFYSVAERFEDGPDGAVLVFKVHERPIVRRVQFIGIKQLKLKELASWTGLKVGSPFDHLANSEAVNRIEQEYKERGYYFARVELVKGGDPSHREVIFRIYEGPKVRVQERGFTFVGQGKSGNKLTDSLTWLIHERESKDGAIGLSPAAARLRTKLKSKEALFGFFGGIYKPESVAHDVDSLKQYYLALGFFDVDIKGEPKFSEDRSSVRLEYTINEGVPFKVRNISLNGCNVLQPQQLREIAELRKGQYFNSLALSKDVQFMLSKYGERGHYFASVVPVPKYTEQPGIVDIEFEIDEDRVCYVRNVNVLLEGEHPHTKPVIAVNQLQIEPGDKANPRLIGRGRSRIAGSSILENVTVDVVPVDQNSIMNVSSSRNVRGQNGVGYQPSWTDAFGDPNTAPRPFVGYGHSTFPTAGPRPAREQSPPEPAPAVSFIGDSNTPRVIEYSAAKPANIFNQTQDALLVPSFTQPRDTIIRGQSPNSQFYDAPAPNRGDLVLEGSPYNNQFQALPPGWVDINVSAAEGRTGRLMIGAGVNSDAGIVGSFVWDERNFDLFRPPATFADIIEGKAWRGGGQRFRLEAAPGDQVSRYAISWTDPYFMYSDYSLGLSGFYFNRFYPDWDETRVGGRITLGKQLTPEWSISGALRLEDIEINNPRGTIASGGTVSVPALEAVRGSNFLSGGEVSVSHDTRDSSMLPSEGHFLTGKFEQVFGDFNYSRFELDARQYFTTFRRPDGSGKHVLTVAGNIGYSGDDTPVFERYFAGGFQSFRGFAFRGVTPRAGGPGDNISVGANAQVLGTAEYRIPVTADEMISMVAFTDFGTVENDFNVDNFRVTVGVGLRVVVPAMGPVPLAFDFGFPVKSAEFDDERIFSFYVGINR
jgi:outer membrane protein insertion porin family